MVVLTVGSALPACSASPMPSRIDAVQSELATSKVSLDQAAAAHDAGTSPKIDVLRAQVDYQNEQQSLISSSNELAKDKLALARTVGLPLDQKFNLADSQRPMPRSTPSTPTPPSSRLSKTARISRRPMSEAEGRQCAEADLRLGRAAPRRLRHRRLRRPRHDGSPLPRHLYRDRPGHRAHPADRQDPRR